MTDADVRVANIEMSLQCISEDRHDPIMVAVHAERAARDLAILKQLVQELTAASLCKG